MNTSPLLSCASSVREQSLPDSAQEAALQQFVKHSARFSAIIRRVLAKRLRTLFDPEDLLQEVAVALLSKPTPRPSSQGMLTHYIAGIARNIALAHNRKHLDGRHHSLHCEMPLASVREVEMPSAPEPDCYKLAQAKEALVLVQDWLPMRVHEIVMWVFQGYSVAEVAAKFDIDKETVIMFVCTANNYSRHPERQIDKEAALRLFQSSGLPRRKKNAGVLQAPRRCVR